MAVPESFASGGRVSASRAFCMLTIKCDARGLSALCAAEFRSLNRGKRLSDDSSLKHDTWNQKAICERQKKNTKAPLGSRISKNGHLIANVYELMHALALVHARVYLGCAFASACILARVSVCVLVCVRVRACVRARACVRVPCLPSSLLEAATSGHLNLEIRFALCP